MTDFISEGGRFVERIADHVSKGVSATTNLTSNLTSSFTSGLKSSLSNLTNKNSLQCESVNITTDHIDKIDDLNKSGTLEGLTFYQGEYNQRSSTLPQPPTSQFAEIMSADKSQTVPIPIALPVKTKANVNHEIEQKLEMSMLESDSEDDHELILNSKRNYGSKSSHRSKQTLEKKIQNYNVASDAIIESNKLLSNKFSPIFEKKKNQNDNILDKISENDIQSLDNSNLLYYSHFFELDDNAERVFILNVKDMFKELGIVLFFHLFLGIHNAIFNVITIDGILSCIIFYMTYIGVEEQNNFLSRNRLMTLDRYIYYLLLFFGYYLYNFMSWFKFANIVMFFASIMICPSIMGQVYNIYAYKKIRIILYDGYNRLVQKIVCKQLSKIINLIIKNILNINTHIGYQELLPYYNKFSWLIVNKFIVTFVMACIFNHIDKGGMKFPMMIYKNLYMKDNKYNISDDKKYLETIIKDKQWDKFMSIYTLNRIIRMVVNDDAQNSMLSEQVSNFLQKVFFRINRIMFCWTAMNICGVSCGILCYLLFIFSSEKPMRYLINTLVFATLSFYTDERILIIVLCELFYPIVDSKLLTDVTDDTYQSLKRGFMSLYYRTRLESVLLSITLACMSYYGYNVIGILLVCMINVVIMLRFYISLKPNDTQKTDTVENTLADDITERIVASIPITGSVKKINDLIRQTRRSHQFLQGIRSDDVTHTNENKDSNEATYTDDGHIDHLCSSTIDLDDIEEDLSDDSCRDYINRRIYKSRSNIPKLGNSSDDHKQDVLMHRVNKIDSNSLSDPSGKSVLVTFDDIELNDTIHNTDLLLILRDRIKTVLKNNLLIRVINPFKYVEPSAVLRIYAHVFLLLMFGFLSNFHLAHIVALPIIVQNVIDVLF